MDAVRVERFYLGCLAHASYMVASDGIAAVIDPQRDVHIYIEMAERNGWTIAHIVPVKDCDEIFLGQCRLEFLHTPGHTLESICVVMTDLANPGNAKTVFTGDTLFLGDVGRPDLSPTHTPQQLAAVQEPA